MKISLALLMLAASAMIVGAEAHAQRVPETTTPSVKLPSQKELGRIKGTAFDSLSMKPVARATVMLMDGTETVIADERGRFEFTNIAAGVHEVAFSSPSIDSLGLGTLGTSVTLAPGGTVDVKLATPSFKTLWEFRCKGVPALSNDSGIVWGTIRDAVTDAPVNGASTAFAWYSLNPGTSKGLFINEIRKDAFSDASGHYFACGLPTDVAIASIGVSKVSASGAVQYSIGFSRLRRMDLLISEDMVIPDSVRYRTLEDSIAADKAHGKATLRGTVHDEKNRPVANANVSIASADTSVTTNANGQFILGRLPAGTQVLQVRGIGFAPTAQLVDFRPDSTVHVELLLSKVTTINTVNVRAALVKGADRVDYENRKRQGFGYFFDAKDFAGRFDMGSVVCRVPGLQCKYNVGFGFLALMRGTFTSYCQPNVYLDGMKSSLDMVTAYPPDHFQAVEVYPRGPMVPLGYTDMNGCGAFLFWSANARW